MLAAYNKGKACIVQHKYINVIYAPGLTAIVGTWQLISPITYTYTHYIYKRNSIHRDPAALILCLVAYIHKSWH